MISFSSVLLALDFNSDQDAAIERAVTAAKRYGGSLRIMTVVEELPSWFPPLHTRQWAQEALENTVRERESQLEALGARLEGEGIPITTLVKTGTGFIEIIREVLREDHKLVVVAGTDKSPIEGKLLGSTSIKLVRKCPCPVWIVKPSDSGVSYDNVMAAIDVMHNMPEAERTDLNHRILQVASGIGEANEADIHVTQVWSVYAEGYLETRGGVDQKSVHELRAEVKHGFVEAVESLLAFEEMPVDHTRKHFPMNQNAWEEIVGLVESESIDLLVMGSLGRAGLGGFFIGNTAEKVLSRVDCSVIALKPDDYVCPITLDD